MFLMSISLFAALPAQVHRVIDSLGPVISKAQIPSLGKISDSPNLPGNGLNPTLLNWIHKGPGATRDRNTKDTTYIIGDTPGETLLITGTWQWNGDVQIVNDGVLLVQGGTLSVYGDIQVLGRGKFLVYDGVVRYPQIFTYQFGTFVAEGGRMEARRSTFDYNGFSYNLFVGDSASLEWDSLSMTKGFTTAVAMAQDTLQINIRDVNVAGEWLFWGPVQAHFAQVDTMLAWFPYGNGVVVDITLPPWENVDHFVMADGVPGVSGLEYSVVLDTISYCMWGTILEAGSDITFRDSPVRSIGIMGNTADSQDVSGLVNGTTYTDFTLGMSDRNFRLVNTSVMTWSLYPSDSFVLTFDHCIVGEVLTMQNSLAWGTSYFLDGTGGHFEASENSFNFAFGSSMTCEVFTRANGVGLLAAVGIPVAFGGIWARNSSRLLLINCQFPGKPVAYDSGLVWVMGKDEPFYGATESNVPIIGTASIIEGPMALYHFDHYNIYWAPDSDTTVWNPIDNPHNYQVWRDTLAVWDTHGLEFGTYLIKLVMWDDSPDSIPIVDYVVLNHEDTTGAVVEKPQRPQPQLIPGPGVVRVIMPRAGAARLAVFDPAGRLVMQQQAMLQKGEQVFQMPNPAGVYMVRLETGGKTLSTRVLKLKR